MSSGRARLGWPEYCIEAWALGAFMVSAALVSTAVEDPGAALHSLLGSDGARRGVIGFAMGATAMALIYSPWGRRSGAHMNPAVTLAFWSLERISTADALAYASAQFSGGLLGVLLSSWILGARFTQPPVSCIVTVPGPAGWPTAFLAEMFISALLMLAILTVSNSKRWSRYAGIVAGCLIACYVTYESPLSGMSMNPARTLASAWPAGIWRDVWIYFAAPCLGMWIAAQIFDKWTPWSERSHHSAKIVHTGA